MKRTAACAASRGCRRQPTRRRFLARFTAIAGASLASQRRFLSAQPPDQSPAGQSYVDFHVHLTQRWYGQKHGPLTARQLLRWMDRHQVERAVVLPLVSPESFWYPVSSEYVLSETAPHRDRLTPFCAIDPRTLATHLPEQEQVIAMLQRYQDAGARGFGEHKARLPIDDPLNLRLYEACAEVKFPVLFHLDNYANTDQPGLPGLARVLSQLPELTMIGHGKGWWASISGDLQQQDLQVGYPEGRVAPGGAVDRLMSRFPNLYGDLSSSGAHAMLRDRQYGRKFLLRHRRRLLFGTDYYALTQKEFIHFDLFNEFDLPGEVVARICRENALELLDR